MWALYSDMLDVVSDEVVEDVVVEPFDVDFCAFCSIRAAKWRREWRSLSSEFLSESEIVLELISDDSESAVPYASV